MLKIILDWILRNANFRIYTSQIPIGKRLGGHDDPQLPDLYIILDIQAGGRLLLLGYFQTS